MILCPQLINLKTQADQAWLQAEELAAKDADVEQIDALYDAAFEKYKKVHQELKKLEADTLKLCSPEEIIHLYYIYKTLATAHYDLGEYEEAHELFIKAFDIHEEHHFLFTKEVSPRDLHAVRFNAALAKLQSWLQGFDKASKEDILSIARDFINDLYFLRQTQKVGHVVDRAFHLIMKCHKLFTEKKPSLPNGFTERKLLWLFSNVLNTEQMLHYIMNDQEGELQIEPPLSAQQQQLLASFTVPKGKVEKNIASMLSNMDAFQESADFGKLKLHDFQLKALNNFKNHLAKGNNKGFYTSATGTGKTRIFISSILATGSKTIILVPSIALAVQTKERIEELLKEININKSVGLFADKEKSTGDIVIMTNNSLKAQLKRMPKKRDIKLENYPLVVFDEVHLSLTEVAEEIVQEFAEDKVIMGCTATDKYNTKRPKGALESVGQLLGEQNHFFEYPIAQAIEDNNLSPVHICMVTTDTSLQWRRTKKRRLNQDISEKEAAERINKDKLNIAVAEIYANAIHPDTAERIFGKQAVAFCAGIEHAQAVAEKFNEAFRDDPYCLSKSITPAAYISGEMSRAQQEKILADHREGKILLLCGSDLLVTGIDNPNCSVVFNLRPTRSQVMALQRGGRAVRKSKEFPNKVALIFEFNWVVEGQVFLHDFLKGQYKLGKIPETLPQNQKLQKVRREEVAIQFSNSARWELDWTGKVREHTVGIKRNVAEIKIPLKDQLFELLEVQDVPCMAKFESDSSEEPWMQEPGNLLFQFSPEQLEAWAKSMLDGPDFFGFNSVVPPNL